MFMPSAVPVVAYLYHPAQPQVEHCLELPFKGILLHQIFIKIFKNIQSIQFKKKIKICDFNAKLILFPDTDF